jgi:hypothetical protein
MFAEIFEKWTPNLWKIVYCPRDWVTITNIQHNVYFAYLFLNCWDYENFNLKLLNLIFLNK